MALVVFMHRLNILREFLTRTTLDRVMRMKYARSIGIRRTSFRDALKTSYEEDREEKKTIKVIYTRS